MKTQTREISTIRRSILRLLRHQLLSGSFVLYLSVLLFLVLLPFVPTLGRLANLRDICSNMWPLFVLVLGQMFVLILGGIDLSQTSIMAITSVIGALMMTSSLDPDKFQNNPLWGIAISENGGPLAGSALAVPAGVLAMLLAGSLIGLLNGIAVARFKMPPFMVTLVAMIFFSGLAIYLTGSENVRHLPDSFIAIGKGAVEGISSPFLIAASLGVLAHIILAYTLLGRWFYAVGRNIKASIVSGVPTTKVIILGYVFSGFCAAVASILYSARLEHGRPTLGHDLLLDVIGAAVIGGISLFGGKGKALWALFGVLFFTLLANALRMFDRLFFYHIEIIKGGVILLAAVLDVTRTRIMTRQGGEQLR
ncbi:MAG: ABC transporter permease [Phycisphaerales bacterium]|nr:MAG: ABC transporter permease [Phycisphaerales bacterium]